MPGELTIGGLRAVRKAATLRSISAAAEALGYTQSAVSRQIAAAEAAVDARLFERIGRGVVPTEAGEVLAEHANDVLGALEAAQQAVGRVRQRLEGQLVLGAFPAAMSVLMPRAVARLAHGNPTLRISLHDASTPALIERMRDGLLDLAVVAIGPDLPDYDLSDLRRDVLLSEALRVAVPAAHPLARRSTITVADLRNEPWVVGEAASATEPIFAAWPTLEEPRIAYASQQWPTRLGMVAAGLGIALIPGLAAESVPAGVTVIDVDDATQPRRTAVAITPADRSAAAKATVAALRSEAARIALTRPRPSPVDSTSATPGT